MKNKSIFCFSNIICSKICDLDNFWFENLKPGELLKFLEITPFVKKLNKMPLCILKQGLWAILRPQWPYVGRYCRE